MSNARKLQRIHHATARFSAARDVLCAELERGGAPRALLDLGVELAALYVEATGGTLVTSRMRAELAVIAARVSGEPVLRDLDGSAERQAPSVVMPSDIDWQIETERKRAAGWVQTETAEGIVYGPGPAFEVDRYYTGAE